MANILTGNPIFWDTAGATSAITDRKIVKLFQWIASGGDIADNDTCVIVVNGVTLTAAIERPTDVGFSPTVLWELNFGDNGMVWDSCSLTTMGTGQCHIWVI